MNRVLKVLIIVIVSGLAVVGAIVTCTGFAIKEGIGHAIDKSMDAGPQTVALTADGASITKQIGSNQVVVLKGVQLCVPEGQPMSKEFSSSVGCVAGTCESTLTFPGPIPQSVAIHRDYQGKCVPQTITDLPRYVVKAYSAKIKVDADLVKKLNIADLGQVKIEKTSNSKFSSSGYTRFGNDTVVDLSYVAPPASTDEFLFNGKLIHVGYSNLLPAGGTAIASAPVFGQGGATVPTAGAEAGISFQINGKNNEKLNLGDAYKFNITGAPPNASFRGHCKGAANCDDWFFVSTKTSKTDARGNFLWESQLAPNWNIPLTTYQLWVSFDDKESNRATFLIEASKGSKDLPPPTNSPTAPSDVSSAPITASTAPGNASSKPGNEVPSSAASGPTNSANLQLTIDGATEVVLNPGASNTLSVMGGEPAQVLIPHCEGPATNPCPAVGFLMQARLTLDGSGQQKMILPVSLPSALPPGKYTFWFSRQGEKPDSNKVTITVSPGRTQFRK